MLTLEKRNQLCQKFNINPDNIKYATYRIVNQDNNEVIGIDLELISLRINIRCHMSKSMIFNFKRCLKMINCILDKYNVDNKK